MSYNIYNIDQMTVAVDLSGNAELREGYEREHCPSCDTPFCTFQCDGSKGADDNNTEDEADVAERLRINASLDTLESFTVALMAALAKRERLGEDKWPPDCFRTTEVHQAIYEAALTVHDQIGKIAEE